MMFFTLEFASSGFAVLIKRRFAILPDGKLKRRKDLTGVHLQAVIEYYPPLAMYNKSDLSQRPFGLVPDVFHEFQRIMNFTYDLRC